MRAAGAPLTQVRGPIGIALGPMRHPLIDELVEAVLAGSADIGRDACVIGPGDDQSALGVLLGVGNPRYFRPVFAAPASCLRMTWTGEPVRLRREPAGGPVTRLARSPLLDHLRPMVRPMVRPFKNAPLPGPLARRRAAATIERRRTRHRRDAAARWLQVDRVVVTSRDRRDALIEHGVHADAVPFGYAAAAAGPLTAPGAGDRDLALVSLGMVDPRRAIRRGVMQQWQAEEPRLTVLHGVWGEERGRLLRRARTVLNVSRTPGNFVGVRLVLALAAGAVVVTEPMTDPYPFQPGVHFVQAPLEGLLDAARELCADEPRRRRIAEAGQALLADELSMANCLRRALGPAA
jgi:hypothetical protein